MDYWFGVVSFALFGLLFGSFGNVLIWRVPRGESIVSPGSHCPFCNAPVRWYDNIPVLSWLVLRGRCRDCSAPIAPRYLLVETTTGALFAVAALKFGFSVQAAAAALMFWLLLVLSAIDLDCMRLPNPLVGTLAAIGLAGAAAGELLDIAIVPLVSVPDSGAFGSPLAWSLLGAVLGALVPGLIAVAFSALRRKRGLGFGDVKLLGALGLFLGPYVVLTLFFGSLIGAVVGIAAARGGSMHDTKIPFGPPLAAAGVLTALAGPAIAAWYLGVTGIA